MKKLIADLPRIVSTLANDLKVIDEWPTLDSIVLMNEQKGWRLYNVKIFFGLEYWLLVSADKIKVFESAAMAVARFKIELRTTP